MCDNNTNYINRERRIIDIKTIKLKLERHLVQVF